MELKTPFCIKGQRGEQKVSYRHETPAFGKDDSALRSDVGQSARLNIFVTVSWWSIFKPRRVSMDTEATRASGPEAYHGYVEDTASPAGNEGRRERRLGPYSTVTDLARLRG
jgi:hypothetical protein